MFSKGHSVFFCSARSEHHLSTISEHFLEFRGKSEHSNLSTYRNLSRSEHLILSTYWDLGRSEHQHLSTAYSFYLKLSTHHGEAGDNNLRALVKSDFLGMLFWTLLSSIQLACWSTNFYLLLREISYQSELIYLVGTNFWKMVFSEHPELSTSLGLKLNWALWTEHLSWF